MQINALLVINAQDMEMTKEIIFPGTGCMIQKEWALEEKKG